MKPAPFDYCRPDSLDEALDVLARLGNDATVLAGGMSLGALLNMRLVRPRVLVDVKRVAGLPSCEEAGGAMRLGATLRQAEAMKSAALMRELPLLAGAFPHVGHFQTRNRGTIGGSVAHADPSAEIPLCLATLDGAVELRSRRGGRTVRARDFCTGIMSTARAPDELLTATIWPCCAPGTGYAFDEVSQRHGDFAIVAAACCASMDGAGRVAALEVGLGGVEDRPVVVDTRAFLGASPARDYAAAVAGEAARGVTPMADIKASAPYRRALVRTLVERVVTTALAATRRT